MLENQQSAYAKTKTQTNFAVTAKRFSAFGFSALIVKFLSYLCPTFQASSLLLRLYRLDYIRPGWINCWFLISYKKHYVTLVNLSRSHYVACLMNKSFIPSQFTPFFYVKLYTKAPYLYFE